MYQPWYYYCCKIIIFKPMQCCIGTGVVWNRSDTVWRIQCARTAEGFGGIFKMFLDQCTVK